MTETPITEEMVMALADGELDGDTATAVRAEVENNPELKALYEDMLETRQALVQAFGASAPDDKYGKFLDQIETYGVATDETEPKPDNVIQVNFFRRMPELARLAATLVIGVSIGGVSWNALVVSDATRPSMWADKKIEVKAPEADQKRFITRGGKVERDTVPKHYLSVFEAITPLLADFKVSAALARKMPAAHRDFFDALDLLRKGGEKADSEALRKLQQASEDGHPLASIAIAELVELNHALRFYRQGLQQLHALISE